MDFIEHSNLPPAGSDVGPSKLTMEQQDAKFARYDAAYIELRNRAVAEKVGNICMTDLRSEEYGIRVELIANLPSDKSAGLGIVTDVPIHHKKLAFIEPGSEFIIHIYFDRPFRYRDDYTLMANVKLGGHTVGYWIVLEPVEGREAMLMAAAEAAGEGPRERRVFLRGRASGFQFENGKVQRFKVGHKGFPVINDASISEEDITIFGPEVVYEGFGQAVSDASISVTVDIYRGHYVAEESKRVSEELMRAQATRFRSVMIDAKRGIRGGSRTRRSHVVTPILREYRAIQEARVETLGFTIVVAEHSQHKLLYDNLAVVSKHLAQIPLHNHVRRGDSLLEEYIKLKRTRMTRGDMLDLMYESNPLLMFQGAEEEEEESRSRPDSHAHPHAHPHAHKRARREPEEAEKTEELDPGSFGPSDVLDSFGPLGPLDQFNPSEVFETFAADEAGGADEVDEADGADEQPLETFEALELFDMSDPVDDFEL